MRLLFAFLISIQFVVVVSHDWVDWPGWNHGRQVQAVVGRRKLAIATLINALFPGIAVAFAWLGRAAWYEVFYCAITVVSAIAMWYVPYFFGASEETQSQYEQMYAGTRQVLPARGRNPRPNLVHLWFHALFAVNLGLAITQFSVWPVG